jgi:predicted nucleic acid-binding protein
MLAIFDTNIFIYGAQLKLDLDTLRGIEVGYASVTKIEALGFWNIGTLELMRLSRWFDESLAFELDQAIVLRAIELRQQKRMSLGDAVIAATALVQDAVLWTANEADFMGIDGLRVHNPLAA